jgi:hypothetical protein
MIAINVPSLIKCLPGNLVLSRRVFCTRLLWIGSGIILTLLAGCASQRAYDGPARPLEEVAIVDGRVTFNAARGGFESSGLPPPRTIDDLKFGTLSLGRVDHKKIPKGAKWAEVLPGTHRLYYRFEMGRWYSYFTPELNAQAGHVYSVDAFIVGRKLKAKIIDITDTFEGGSLRRKAAEKR